MIKSELIDSISIKNPHLRRVEVEKLVDAILDEITSAMARGDRVELRGFGTFSVSVWEARTARNPKTGVAVAVPKKANPRFKAGKEMTRRLNPNDAQ